MWYKILFNLSGEQTRCTRCSLTFALSVWLNIMLKLIFVKICCYWLSQIPGIWSLRHTVRWQLTYLLLHLFWKGLILLTCSSLMTPLPLSLSLSPCVCVCVLCLLSFSLHVASLQKLTGLFCYQTGEFFCFHSSSRVTLNIPEGFP